ncbi:hypothetical protein [Polaromonas sp. JS666]|uniref:hypothetical protein n=1 Tax=Polaromonas sp. (strain JS666 / ATCC BAA-500) TaxID=296591 RepID=UPI00088E304E|nr:hypothetical protein [Polaromonas sp. JS666]SDM37583.1 hypothetical protein SAMN05720382_101144 [Polaromonas sp. JS666]
MFERLKKVFVAGKADAGDAATSDEAVSEWAGTRGFSFTGMGQGKGFALKGNVGGKPWKMERGRPSRDYIRGEELRARGEIKVNDDVTVLVMNRALKDALEKKAYQAYTDTLQTTADPNMPEEVRWLAMYPEVGWESLPKPFWERYAVMADHRSNAMAWLDPQLVELMMSWPEPAPDPQVPFILMVLRGKAYLRMQYTPADMPTLEHAALIFTTACESAIAGLSNDLTL